MRAPHPAPRWWARAPRGRAPQPRPPLHAAHAPYTRGARTPLSPQPFQMLPGFAIISAAFTLTGFGVYGLSYIKWGWKVRRALAVTHTRAAPPPSPARAHVRRVVRPQTTLTRVDLRSRAAPSSRARLFRLQDGDARRAPPQEVGWPPRRGAPLPSLRVRRALQARDSATRAATAAPRIASLSVNRGVHSSCTHERR